MSSLIVVLWSPQKRNFFSSRTLKRIEVAASPSGHAITVALRNTSGDIPLCVFSLRQQSFRFHQVHHLAFLEEPGAMGVV